MTINFTEYKNKREKENENKYVEINTHDTYGLMGISVWDAIETREMLMHTLKDDNKAIINSYMEKLVNGETITLVSGNITSTFKIATEDDERKAKEYAEAFDKEINDSINNEDYDDSVEKLLLSRLGLNNLNKR
jgi:uncharacterized radical SAM superfamily protein